MRTSGRMFISSGDCGPNQSEYMKPLRTVTRLAMNVSGRTTVLLASLLLVSCSDDAKQGFREGFLSVVSPDEHFENQRALLRGTWAWEPEQCRSRPIAISFSQDHQAMWHDMLDDGSTEGSVPSARRFDYRILESTADGLRVRMQQEQGLDTRGDPIGWDLQILDDDNFCWRRSDWADHSCTDELSRCLVERVDRSRASKARK